MDQTRRSFIGKTLAAIGAVILAPIAGPIKVETVNSMKIIPANWAMTETIWETRGDGKTYVVSCKVVNWE